MNTLLQHSIESLCEKWHLRNVEPFVKMPFLNYVAKAYSHDYKKDVVLKILLTKTNEPEALLFFDGNSCVKLLAYDKSLKGLLLEYISPGTTLKTFFPNNDVESLYITAEIIKKLHTKKDNEHQLFKTIDQWVALLATFSSTKIPHSLVQRAWHLSQELLILNQDVYVLHGDLHHENILRKGNMWIAIDPKGVVGPLEFEVIRFIMNPFPQLLQCANVSEIIRQRVAHFSKIFDFDKHRLMNWLLVSSVLSACWSEADEGKVFSYFLDLAKLVETMI